MLQRLFQIQPFSCLTPQLPLSLSPPPWSILHWSLHAIPLTFAMLTLLGIMGESALLFDLIESGLMISRLALHTKNGTSTKPTTSLRLIVAISTVACVCLMFRTFCLGLVALFLQLELKTFAGQALVPMLDFCAHNYLPSQLICSDFITDIPAQESCLLKEPLSQSLGSQLI